MIPAEAREGNAELARWGIGSVMTPNGTLTLDPARATPEPPPDRPDPRSKKVVMARHIHNGWGTGALAGPARPH